jgi:predicted acyltransferase
MGYVYSVIMGRYKHEPQKMLTIWITISVIAGALVYPMTLLMPLNKKLYSASFTLIVVAISGAVLSFFYVLVDLWPVNRPRVKRVVGIVTAPLLWLGLNPLAIFVLMDLLAIFMIIYIKIDDVSIWTQFYRHVFASWINDHQVGAIVFACFFLLLWTAVAGLMHRFKFYVRL